MTLNTKLQERSGGACEICGTAGDSLLPYTISPKPEEAQYQVAVCGTCLTKIEADDFTDTHYWRCLEGSIWSETDAVKVLSYRLLSKLEGEEWALEARENAFLDEEQLAWAEAQDRMAAEVAVHLDSFGSVLQAGDNVVLTQNLNVKGTNYIAPKGTMVRKIRLVADNADQIEGKINGDTIVILCKFVKKA